MVFSTSAISAIARLATPVCRTACKAGMLSRSTPIGNQVFQYKALASHHHFHTESSVPHRLTATNNKALDCDNRKNASIPENDKQLATAEPSFTSLTLSGAGAKGSGYTGLVSELEKQGQLNKLNEIVGASIGGIIGIPLALGMKSSDLTDWMSQSSPKFCAEQMRLQLNTVIVQCLGEHLDQIASYLQVHQNPLQDAQGKPTSLCEVTTESLHNLTFRQLALIRQGSLEGELKLSNTSPLKRLVISASEYERRELELSAENSPNVSIVTAAIASSSFPKKMMPVVLPRTAFVSEPESSASNIELSDAVTTNNTPHVFATGNNRLVVNPFSRKTLLKTDHTLSDSLFEMMILKAKSIATGVDLVTSTRLARFDVQQAVSDPRVHLLFLRVPIAVTDFKAGIEKLRSIELDTAKQTQKFLTELKQQPIQPQAIEQSHSLTALTPEQYMRRKYQ
ncbi:MAG: patatin-like phospholipase family protein [Parashewanella sp.]